MIGRATHSLSTQGGVISGQHKCVSLNESSASGQHPLLAGGSTTSTRTLGLSVGRDLVVSRCFTAVSSDEVLGVPRPLTVGDGDHPPARDAQGVPRPELEVYYNPNYNKSFLKAESVSDDSYTNYYNSIPKPSPNDWARFFSNDILDTFKVSTTRYEALPDRYAVYCTITSVLAICVPPVELILPLVLLFGMIMFFILGARVFIAHVILFPHHVRCVAFSILYLPLDIARIVYNIVVDVVYIPWDVWRWVRHGLMPDYMHMYTCDDAFMLTGDSDVGDYDGRKYNM
jgi:hypothetical protein